MKLNVKALSLLLFFPLFSTAQVKPIQPVLGSEVTITDDVWTPILERTSKVTIPDILGKFEGLRPEAVDGADFTVTRYHEEQDALRNFQAVANGERGTGTHIGAPWFDGLIYETITGIADHLMHHPDAMLQMRMDNYISLIAAAQKVDPDGYLNTYTTLNEPDHRWGENGGNLRWQHDVYNCGALIEAGVHYYQATGKTELLSVATKLANYMYRYMVQEKHNVVPGHALPESALIQLYRLYHSIPRLKEYVKEPVTDWHYLALAEYWIDQRGHTEGRRPLEAYAQDAVPFTHQQTIEGHAVRATLLAEGATMAAIESQRSDLRETVDRLWNNMVGKRMFVTGGVGAIHEDEKFGPDYFLPNDAYLETCAAVGAGMFSWRMNQMTGDAKYIDVLERVLYNSMLVCVSTEGDTYTYQNPLNADNVERWAWHDCPCCPPMFLKMTGALPSMIYATRGHDLYVNLFVGSEADVKMPGCGIVNIKQQVDWTTGQVRIQVKPETDGPLRVLVRIPGWTNSQELPLGLYTSRITSFTQPSERGYAICEKNQYGNIELNLNVSPRVIRADEHVKELEGMMCLASGPFIYCVEQAHNPDNWHILTYNTGQALRLTTKGSPFPEQTIRNRTYRATPIITTDDGLLRATPYYLIGNLEKKTSYKVWVK